MAAARVNVLVPKQIVERLDNAVHLLTRGVQSNHSRHQTLRAALDWSFELLPTKEQAFFTRLSIFAGSFGVDAVEGVCAGAGAIVAMASDIRYASANAKTAFLFTRVGLAGCDMGACAILPRIIGHGRASELLYTGRSMSAEEGERWGFFNKLTETPLIEAQSFATSLANGPAFAHSMTKNQLNMEWNMSLEQALEAEAQAQAICMKTRDFERAYVAFASKQKPVFEGD